MCLKLISSPQSQGISQRAGWRGGGGGGKDGRARTGGSFPGQTWTPIPRLRKNTAQRWEGELGEHRKGRRSPPLQVSDILEIPGSLSAPLLLLFSR